jgi:hypothetical protein
MRHSGVVGHENPIQREPLINPTRNNLSSREDHLLCKAIKGNTAKTDQ